MDRVDVSELVSPSIHALHVWYSNLPCEAGKWPSADHFLPQDIPPRILPKIGKVTVEVDPFRVFYRVVGTNICDSLGMNVSGKYLDETGLEQTTDLENIYRFLLTDNDQFFVKGPQVVFDCEFEYEGCALPFGCEQDNPRLFLIAEDFFPEVVWREALYKRSYETNL